MLRKLLNKLMGAAPPEQSGLRSPLEIRRRTQTNHPKAQPKAKPKPNAPRARPVAASVAPPPLPEAEESPAAPVSKKKSGLDLNQIVDHVVRELGQAPTAVAEPGMAEDVGNGHFRLFPANDPGKKVCQFQAVRFEIHNNWVVEYVPNLDGILVFVTDYKSVSPANLYFEFKRDIDDRTLENCLNDLNDALKFSREGYDLTYSQIREHHNGFSYGIVEFTCLKGGVKHVEWEIVVPYYDNLQLCISASSARTDWRKNHESFCDVLYSLCPQSM